ncbi:MAG TPA: L-histidine N(alpha)-methyltransferase [Vicinamibacterales bacterium]|nr:L-histidine N(alpha)-methyltransferase [Vicinamibacterales bacterium]
MSTPRSAAFETLPANASRFAEDVAYYLSLTPRQLPSHYLYDELGSTLFEAICRLPWYRVTRAEQHLLHLHARDIFAGAGQPKTCVELGPGNGEKLAGLLHAAAPADRLTVHLVDVSSSALEAAARTLSTRPRVNVVLHRATYDEGLTEVGREVGSGERVLTLFLGSNIGNFDPPGAEAFLRRIRATVSAGDSVLLGTDLIRPESDLMLAYDDPLGVTAAFNRNLLVRINRELEADFDVSGFSHRAVWNAPESRVEMHLVSTQAQRVRIPAAGLDLTFDAGDIIWTESSYKYRPDEAVGMLERAGFRSTGQWIADHFSLTLGEAI